MEVIDIVVFFVDEDLATLRLYESEFYKSFKHDIENKYSVECSGVFELCVEDIESKVKERFLNTQNDEKLYLSIGVLDLVNEGKQKKINGGRGEFSAPNIALAALARVIVPLFEFCQGHFRLVLPTRVIKSCEVKINDPENKRSSVREFTALKNRILEQIETTIGLDWIVHKKEGFVSYGEGKVDEETIKSIREKTLDLISEEIEYSGSPDAVYRKR